MVKGKDRPHELGPLEFEDQDKTVGLLLLHMLKGIYYSGQYVVLDSGLCMLKGVVALKRKGVFAGALIKKR